MISCEKENLKNLSLDMANRLHSDVALTWAHWAGMSPTACSLSLPSNTALGPGDTKELSLQLSPTSSSLPFHQLLPAAGAAPCRATMHSPMPGLGSFSPSALASCPGSVTRCTISSQSSHFCCSPISLFHALYLTKCVLKSVGNFLCSLTLFSDGFGLDLLWPKHIQQSIHQPPDPQRSTGSPAAHLLAQYRESRQHPCTVCGARTRSSETNPVHLHSGCPLAGSMRGVKVRE